MFWLFILVVLTYTLFVLYEKDLFCLFGLGLICLVVGVICVIIGSALMTSDVREAKAALVSVDHQMSVEGERLKLLEDETEILELKKKILGLDLSKAEPKGLLAKEASPALLSCNLAYVGNGFFDFVWYVIKWVVLLVFSLFMVHRMNKKGYV